MTDDKSTLRSHIASAHTTHETYMTYTTHETYMIYMTHETYITHTTYAKSQEPVPT